MPTQAQRAGDFTGLLNSAGQLVVIYDPTTTVSQGSGFVRQPFPGNVIPANRIDRVGKNIAAYYAQPNRPGAANTGVNNYFASPRPLCHSPRGYAGCAGPRDPRGRTSDGDPGS